MKERIQESLSIFNAYHNPVVALQNYIKNVFSTSSKEESLLKKKISQRWKNS